MNKVILMGRLVKKESKTIGKKKEHIVNNFCIAIDKLVNDEKQTEFFNLVAWDKKADFIEKYIEIGKRMLVEGYLTIDEYEDEEEKKHKITKIVATSIEFADGFTKKEETKKAKKQDDEDELPF